MKNIQVNDLPSGFIRKGTVQSTSLTNAKCRECDKKILNGTIALTENNFNPNHRGKETAFSTVLCMSCGKDEPEVIQYKAECKQQDKQARDIQSKVNKVRKLAIKLGIESIIFNQ